MQRLIAAISVSTFIAAAPATFAQQEGHGDHGAAPTAAVPRTASGTGLVQRIDAAKGEVTLKHGPLPALGMPAMTMAFPVQDKAVLANLKPLQKVDFELQYDGRNYLITRIQ